MNKKTITRNKLNWILFGSAVLLVIVSARFLENRGMLLSFASIIFSLFFINESCWALKTGIARAKAFSYYRNKNKVNFYITVAIQLVAGVGLLAWGLFYILKSFFI